MYVRNGGNVVKVMDYRCRRYGTDDMGTMQVVEGR